MMEGREAAGHRPTKGTGMGSNVTIAEGICVFELGRAMARAVRCDA